MKVVTVEKLASAQLCQNLHGSERMNCNMVVIISSPWNASKEAPTCRFLCFKRPTKGGIVNVQCRLAVIMVLSIHFEKIQHLKYAFLSC